MASLKFWMEVVDRIVDVEEDRVIFRKIGGVNINDPHFLQQLRKYVGKKIAILHTDIPGREYLIREV